SWEFDVSDKERPLKTRGYKDAELVSSAFKSKEIDIDNAYTSPAKRAFETSKIFMQLLSKENKSAIIKNDLYDFGGNSVEMFIKSLPDDENNVMIFGHNHALTSISNIFGSTYIDNVPTSGLVAIKFETNSWNSIKKGTTELTIFPRDLK
ncbi:MAG: histidine phosphatase family protein, partial [Bacteroidia bacterium]|nr:histidine phosphatase family protein [Bacteroidia bacterium]